MNLCCNNCCGDYCSCCGRRIRPKPSPWVYPVPYLPAPYVPVIPKPIVWPQPYRPWLDHLTLIR